MKTKEELIAQFNNGEIDQAQLDAGLKAIREAETLARPTTHKKTGKKKSTSTVAKKAEARRLKRNADSRAWKKAHKTKVITWNKAWAVEQRGDKKKADAMRLSVRGPKGNDKPVRKVSKPRVPKVTPQVQPTDQVVAA